MFYCACNGVDVAMSCPYNKFHVHGSDLVILYYHESDNYGRPVLCEPQLAIGLSTCRPTFNPWLFQVGFVADKVTLE
jgi:hypothetical protein